jgi:hypothetical protein
MAQGTGANPPSEQVAQKLSDLVKDDIDPPVIYRTAPDGTRLRCVWNRTIQEYDCTEVHADGVPRE